MGVANTVGVCDDGAGAWGGLDEGAGGAGGGGGGHDERAERGQRAVGVCDDGAGARSRDDAGVLEGRAEAVAGTFNAQEVANTLWAYATMGREPGAGMMRVREGRAEALAVAGTLNAQDVANTLWAYATMGREPGAGLMKVLEGRAEAVAGTFNAKEVANTLCRWWQSRCGLRVCFLFFAPIRQLRSDWCPWTSLGA
jgi:hypothetical protein